MIRELVKKYKFSIAFLGDIGIFFLSSIIVLYVRYGNSNFETQLSVHRNPLIIVLIIWLVTFYISNLYTYKAFSNILNISRSLLSALAVGFFVTITIFYIFSRFFELTPKANLVMITGVFAILDLSWRYILRKIFLQNIHQSKTLILSASPQVKAIEEHIFAHPQLGYSLLKFNGDIDLLSETIKKNSVDLVVIDGSSLRNNNITKVLYSLLPKQLEIITLTDFFESLFRCIPLSEIEEEWFIREITNNKNVYESIKRFLEIVLIFLTLPIAVFVSLIICFLVAVTSPGPIIYKQERMGKNNKPFTLYKFRTMKYNLDGPLWTIDNDCRITFIGKILRHTHLDEIPQLFNVIKGDISFIGPRAERTKLVEIYKNIPYYEIRHTIKPGIVGWAQLNYKPSASLEEAEKKFQFDLYYLKNRSFVLDIFILIKTVRTFFVKN